MYFLNMLFSKPQLFLYFFGASAVFIPIYMFYNILIFGNAVV
ncbi:unknown [Bacteroides uniformis CAG:3]|nr:unknown [Bacteroides uniformis CAG:3]